MRIFLLLFVFLTPLPAYAAAYIAQPYNMNAQIDCNGKSVAVPPLGFDEASGVWLVTLPKTCGLGDARVYYVFDKECEGQHVCTGAQFSYGSLSPVAEQTFKEAMRQDAKGIMLSSGVRAYFIPSICGTYCAQSKLVWFEAGKVYSLGSKGNMQELIDAANAYIEQSMNRMQE